MAIEGLELWPIEQRSFTGSRYPSTRLCETDLEQCPPCGRGGGGGGIDIRPLRSALSRWTIEVGRARLRGIMRR